MINRNVKLARNIEILQLRFKDWKKSGELRRRKDGSVLWGYRRLATLPNLPTRSVITRICLKRKEWLKKYNQLGKPGRAV